jgi:hypothetical protein
MWFNDDDMAVDRRSRRLGPKPGRTLRADARGARKGANRRLALLLGVPVAAALLLSTLWLGLMACGRALYSENPRFTIKRLDVRAATARTRSLVREYTRLSEGMNLFSFSPGDVRDYVMRYAPDFLSMTISRGLPGTVVIEVVERTPLARIGAQGDLVADGEGCLFVAQTGSRDLPVVVGSRLTDPRPGVRADELTGAALTALEVCGTPAIGLRVQSVDVSQPECIVMQVADSMAVRQVRLAWKGMRERSAAARADLTNRLLWLKTTLASEKGRGMTQFDATFDGKIFGKE